MHWNHRVIFHPHKDPMYRWYGIHECFYEKDRLIPHSWTEEAIRVIEDDLGGMTSTLKRMLKACSKPILEVRGNNLVIHRLQLGKIDGQ